MPDIKLELEIEIVLRSKNITFTSNCPMGDGQVRRKHRSQLHSHYCMCTCSSQQMRSSLLSNTRKQPDPFLYAATQLSLEEQSQRAFANNKRRKYDHVKMFIQQLKLRCRPRERNVVGWLE